MSDVPEQSGVRNSHNLFLTRHGKVGLPRYNETVPQHQINGEPNPKHQQSMDTINKTEGTSEKNPQDSTYCVDQKPTHRNHQEDFAETNRQTPIDNL
jgi:hypothetical protein